MGVDNELVREVTRAADKTMAAAQEWKRRAEAVEDRVAVLEVDATKALDMIRDRLDADPTTMTEAVDGLIKLYKMEFDERFAAQARVEVLEARLSERTADEEKKIDEIVEGMPARLLVSANENNAKLATRVEVLEAEKLALDTCWRCKVTLEKVGPPESRVPRCTECPEPESMDEVDQSGKGGS